MAYGAFGGGLPIRIAVKRKVFVSYHRGGDQPYYDAFAKHLCDTYEVLSDNSLDRIIDIEDVDYVMRRIREDHIRGSSCTGCIGRQGHAPAQVRRLGNHGNVGN